MAVELPVGVIAVAGMAFEARIAARTGTPVVYVGDTRKLTDVLISAIGKDCRGLISFGVAGGLSPALKAGTCIVASVVHAGTTRFATNENWSWNLLQAMPRAIRGEIAGVVAPVVHMEEKRALHIGTGALAVDTESHVVASVAAARGLPMAAVRVITDSAHYSLPQSALAAMRADGTIDIAGMIRSIVKVPGEFPMLLRTARDALVSGLALHRSRRLLGASFGLPD